MSEKIEVGISHASGPGVVVNGDLDDGPKLFICHPEENTAQTQLQEKKKTTHNSTEKKRKDKIRYWINKIGEQLPPSPIIPGKERSGRSTLEIVENAWEYIVQLKEIVNSTSADASQSIHVGEIKKLKQELEVLKLERDKLYDIVKGPDVPVNCNQEMGVQPPLQSQGALPKADDADINTAADNTGVKVEKQKNKGKKRNTISVQLENLKKQQESQNATGMGMQEMMPPGMMGNLGNFPLNNMILGGAGQQLINQQMLMNSMMFGGNQIMGAPSSGVGNGNQMMGLPNSNVNGVGAVGGNQGIPGMFGMQGQGLLQGQMQMQGMPIQGQQGQGQQVQNQCPTMLGQGPNSDKNAAEAGAGLLQLAMQDAGITPNSNGQPSQGEETPASSASTPVSHSAVENSVDQQQQNNPSHSSALHTLASVASNTQNLTNISQTATSVAISNSAVSQNSTGAPTATTQSINTSVPIMATGQNGLSQSVPGNSGNMVNLPFMNGQQQMPGNLINGAQASGYNPSAPPMQQIMFINEQGVPCIANVPVGIDPSVPNMGKQIMGIDKSGNVIIQNMPGQKDQGQMGMNEQALLANTLAQQQLNMALQGQLQGVTSQTFQPGQNNVAMGANGGLLQQSMNNQLPLNQQMIQTMHAQTGLANSNGQLNQQNPQGLILPASQTGNLLTVNSVPTQQSQLPQALLLPNGQIIPVVSNPNIYAGAPGQAGQPQVLQQGAPQIQGQQQIQGGNIQRMPIGPGMMPGDNGQMLVTSTGQLQIGQPQLAVQAPQQVSGQGQLSNQQQQLQQGQGLLMTTNSVLPQISPTSSSTASSSAALLSTSSSVNIESSPSSASSSKKTIDVNSATSNITSSQISQSVTMTTGLSEPSSSSQNVKGQGMNFNPNMTFNPGNNQVVLPNLTSSDNGNSMSVSVSSMSVSQTATMATSDPNNAALTVLNPQLQSVLHGQLGGSTAPILLTMSCNGQPTSILVDPSTMQVLGTVQTQQASQQPTQNQQPSLTSTPPSKKSKKNSQRAICPKPNNVKGQQTNSNTTTVNSIIPPVIIPPPTGGTAAGGVWVNKDSEQMDLAPQQQTQQNVPVKKPSNSKSKSKSKPSKGLNDSVPVTSRTENSSSGEQDILAKAAESIFSEISPVNFYNPANEDNPLQIDTSVCEGEEEHASSNSPVKEAGKDKTKNSSTVENQDKNKKTEQKDQDKAFCESILENASKHSLDICDDNVKTLSESKDLGVDQLSNSNSNTEENDILTNFLKAADLTKSSETEESASVLDKDNTEDSIEESLFDFMPSDVCENQMKSKKSKKNGNLRNNESEKHVDEIASQETNDSTSAKNNKKSSKKSSKRNVEQETVQKTPNVQDQGNSLSLPDTIEFSANDLSAVLDQVEQFGNSYKENATEVTSKKSSGSKSKKSRNETIDSEPVSKKRKKNSSKEKEKQKETSVPQDSPSNNAKSSLSVYDFEEDSPDFSTPLFPLHSSRSSNSTNTVKNSTPQEKTQTPSSSENLLLSMPVISEQNMNNTPLFETTTPKKRSSRHKKNKTADTSNKVNVISENFEKGHGRGNVDNVLDISLAEKEKEKSINITQQEESSHQFSMNENFQDQQSTEQNMDVRFTQTISREKPEESSVGSPGRQSKLEDDRIKKIPDDHYQQKRIESPKTAIDQISLPSTNPLTVDTNDIESTVNNLLGLSPRMISPNPPHPKLKQMQRSPQLQTPKSASPVSMSSPVPMTSPVAMVTSTHQPQVLPTSNEQIMSCPSSTTSCSSMSNFSSPTTSAELPYSAESLFGPQSKTVNTSRQHNDPSKQQHFTGNRNQELGIMKSQEEKTVANRPKSIYSAENFVQSSKSAESRNVKAGQTNVHSSVISPSLPTSFGRSQNENSSDGFNFANIGLNLSTPTTSTNSFIDSLSMSPIISTIANSTSSSEFTFILSSVTSTITTSNAAIMSGSQTSSNQSVHPYPFYSQQHQSPQQASHLQRPPSTSAVTQASNQISNSQPQSHQQQMPNFDMDLQQSVNPQISQASSQHRSKRDRVDRMPSHLPNLQDPSIRYCPVQEQRPQDQNPPPREQLPMFPNITVSSHEGPLNMGMNKPHSEQMRNSHKRMTDLGQRSIPPKSHANEARPERMSNYSMNSMQSFFPPPNFSNANSNALETPPLHHLSNQDRPGLSGRGGYEVFPPNTQGFNSVPQSFSGNRFESSNVTAFAPSDNSGTQPLSHTPPSQNMDGRKSANTPSQNSKTNKSSHSQQLQSNQQSRTLNGPPQPSRSGPTPPQAPPPQSHRPTPPHQSRPPTQSQPPPPTQQQRPKSSSSRSKQSQKRKANYTEMDSALPPHPAMFDPMANRSLTPFLGIPPQTLSPPSRNMQNEGPPLFPGNLFGAGARQGPSMSKNPDFNSLFQPSRPQNGIGFNFQPGFGMNSVHGGMSNSQITPHSGSVTVTPHMSNFTFTNIFSDVNNSSQNDSLNISPIKFPHPNSMLPPQGMDPNSLHHPHQQSSSIYHNRPHPPSMIHNMNINSILGHNHHGFDSRAMPQGISTSVAPPFPGHSHPATFGMPPLNFSMHDP